MEPSINKNSTMKVQMVKEYDLIGNMASYNFTIIESNLNLKGDEIIIIGFPAYYLPNFNQ